MTAPKILVVDDDPINLRLLEAMLRQEGFEIVKASSGADALSAMESERPDLVLLDAIMPVMSGVEVLARLRGMGPVAGLPVVLVSGLSEGEVRSLSEDSQARADAHIGKPIDRKAMIETIRRLLSADERKDQ